MNYKLKGQKVKSYKNNIEFYIINCYDNKLYDTTD